MGAVAVSGLTEDEDVALAALGVAAASARRRPVRLRASDHRVASTTRRSSGVISGITPNHALKAGRA